MANDPETVGSTENMFALRRDDASAEWFDAAARDELLLRRCGSEHWDVPQAMTCSTCGSRDLHWESANGAGTIASYAVIHRRGKDSLPVAIVELTEGPWLRAQLQGVDTADLAIGTPVRIGFATPEGGEPIPFFAPTAAEPAGHA